MADLRLVVLIGILMFGVSSACRPKAGASRDPDVPGAISAADEAKIRSADSAFMAAANAGDVNGILAVYASDAALLAPNLPPQKGHDAIKAFWAGLLEAYTVKFDVGSDAIEGRGDLAYSQGHYRFTAVPKAKGAPGTADEGKFIEILKKQPDGSWKYVVDMYSSNLALQH
jgi:uncharacterized protein (TIGR02246 family)